MKDFLIGACIGIAILMAASAAVTALASPHFRGASPFVQTIERSVGMSPGMTRVLPECGCTIRYNGTSVSGNHYAVHIEKLD